MKFHIVSALIIAFAVLAGAPPAASAAPSAKVLRVADQDEQTWVVLVNHEGRYSIWPEGRDFPAGWRAAGFSGSKAECLDYIRQNQ